MKENPQKQQQLDRLLAGGGPSGPKLDHLWSQIENRLEPAERDRSRSLWQKMWQRIWRPVLIGLLPATAAVALIWWLPFWGSEEFSSRGGPTQVMPLLEATCGEQEAPCVVGQPVYLRVRPRGQRGLIVVTQQRSNLAPLVLGQMQLSGEPGKVFPLQLLPEPGDVSQGVHLRLWWRGDAGEDPGLLQQPDFSKLHLEQAKQQDLLLRVVFSSP